MGLRLERVEHGQLGGRVVTVISGREGVVGGLASVGLGRPLRGQGLEVGLRLLGDLELLVKLRHLVATARLPHPRRPSRLASHLLLSGFPICGPVSCFDFLY